jgi:membrane dipeptidase
MPANGGIVMVTFLSQYLIEPARIRSLKRSREKARLEKSFPRHPKKVRAGLDAWEKANPAPRASLSDVADHIDHVRKIAGINHVGIGGDYEGFDGPPAGLEDVSCYPALLAELMRRGYSIDDIKKVAGLNILRVLEQAEGVAAKLQNIPA